METGLGNGGSSFSASGGNLDAGAVFETDLGLPGRRGKVRDVYDLGGGKLLIVASDRVSAFDVVLPTPMPGKGRLLTGIAAWWLEWIEQRGLCRTHLLSTDAGDIPDEAFTGSTTRADLEGRVTIGAKREVVPVECVVRGYLEGSGWKDYQATGTVCGVAVPEGLERCGALPEPIFTPATKAEEGHDENIDLETACGIAGRGVMEKLRELSLAIYTEAAAHAKQRGILIADTKFEFGVDADGTVTLVDEALTPDSSRFWPAESYEPGKPQPSYDKQFVREYLETLVERGAWDKTDPGPELPADVVEGTLSRYREAAGMLMG